MTQIRFEILKKVLIDYRSYRSNSISPYFAVEFNNFLKYFFDFSKVYFIINTLNYKSLEEKFYLLSERYGSKFQHYYRKSLSPITIDKIPEDFKLFIRDYEKIYQENQDRIEGYLFNDVFVERLSQLSTRKGFKFKELDRLTPNSTSSTVLPDSVIEINGHKVAIEFKTRHFEDKWLLIKKYYFKKYKEYIENEDIENILVLHCHYPFDFDHLPNFYLGLGFLSPSTDSALLIPLDLYERIPIDIEPPLKEKRKDYFGVLLEEAREYDLLYEGWEKLIDNIISFLNNNFTGNISINYIKCIQCSEYYSYAKDCYPYTRTFHSIDYGYCFSCAKNDLRGLSIFLFENGIRDCIDEYVDIQFEMERDFY